jgi:CubicO group peptidase (beta-lactamase class C family)
MESETGYQYQWWRLGENAFSAEGVHGQFIYVNPKAKVVIAKTSTWETAWPEEKALVAIAGFHAIAKYLQSPTER